MLLKLLIGIVVIAIIYRFLGGKIPFIDKPKEKAEHEFGQIAATSECAHCGTYMTEEDAVIYQRKAYCSQECLDAAKKIK